MRSDVQQISRFRRAAARAARRGTQTLGPDKGSRGGVAAEMTERPVPPQAQCIDSRFKAAAPPIKAPPAATPPPPRRQRVSEDGWVALDKGLDKGLDVYVCSNV